MTRSTSGFGAWKMAILSDKESSLEDSKNCFKLAAQLFFEEAGGEGSGVAKALLEYSTLMDALSAVQDGRILKSGSDYEDALSRFAKASEILRATVHYAFAASYVSGCASLETALELGNREEALQGLKNANALFEQSRLALSFRDERHPLMRSIDVLIKYSISKALLFESEILEESGSHEQAKKRELQSNAVAEDFNSLAYQPDFKAETGRARVFKIDYFPEEDWKRAAGALVLVFPEARSLWVGNVGANPAIIESLGSDGIQRTANPGEAFTYPMSESSKGRIRVVYRDTRTGDEYDEGCLTAV